jgi:hypothetical protein
MWKLIVVGDEMLFYSFDPLEVDTVITVGNPILVKTEVTLIIPFH